MSSTDRNRNTGTRMPAAVTFLNMLRRKGVEMPSDDSLQFGIFSNYGVTYRARALLR